MNYQYNHITKEIYQGRNQADLIRAKKANSFKSDAWLTFLQAKYNGLKIKKSSKGVAIFLGYRKFDEKNKDGKIKTVSRPLGFKTVYKLFYDIIIINKLYISKPTILNTLNISFFEG